MRIYPAIDIKDGKCVRLFKGDFQKVTEYGNSPSQMAQKWYEQGATYLHVVDLDGARTGKPTNLDSVEEICNKISIPIQLGGGMRTIDDVRAAFECGVKRVIIGTRVLEDLDFIREATKYGEIAVGLDSLEGKIATHGWEKVSQLDVYELAGKLSKYPVSAIIFTDISTDGTLEGPNVTAMKRMAQTTIIPVIASGGVGKIEDIQALANTKVSGVIVGKALYEGSVTLEDINKIKGGA